jgi:pimeloyl-ACP methyl ester carboxylesterase
MPYLDVEGRKAFFVHRQPVPAGKLPFVFVHGAGGIHRHWLYQVRDLPRLSSYALDLPGHGESNGPGCSSVAAYADWLIGFLDAAGLSQAILVGHSMGGAIALQVALQHPDRVSGLGLVGTGARLRVAPALLEMLQQDFRCALPLVSEWAYGPDASPEMVRQGQQQLTATAPEVVYNDFLACDGFQVMDRLQEIAAPTVVLCGTQDRMTPVKYSTYLADNIRDAGLHLVERAGHMVMLENPEAIAQGLGSLAQRVGEKRG